MTSKTLNVDVAIVGGGILGLSIAALASQRGYTVSLIRLSDNERPCADTLRNQGWLQSGLMYIKKFGIDRAKGRILSKQMYIAGRAMLKDLELPPPDPSEHGIIRVRNDQEADELERDAREMRIPRVGRLSAADSEKALGGFYEAGIYCSIPDGPFPEDLVLTRLRSFAESNGALLIECQEAAQLLPSEKSESGVLLKCNVPPLEFEIRSRITIAAAGAGNWPLLKDLGVDPSFTLRQTPLLVLHQTFGVNAPIFASRVQKFSLVRHPPVDKTLPTGALVVGTTVEREVPFQHPHKRGIDPADKEEFESYLPQILKDQLATGRFTAGYEVVPATSLGLKDVERWVEVVDGYPRLLKVSPGRATMGLHTGREILEIITSQLGPPPYPASKPAPIGNRWDGEIAMHYHPSYSFDDSEY